MREVGRWEAPAVMQDTEVARTGARVLAVVLNLELLWVLLVTAAVVFLAAHLGPGAEDFTGDETVRGVLLVGVPAVAVVLGLALIGARRGVERSALDPSAPLSRTHRLALWVSAGANAVVVGSILTSLYHAQMTWLVVGLLMAIGLGTVAWACGRTARP